jgi:hypothetical protein
LAICCTKLTVEPYRRGDRDYFFAFPEDYAQQSVEWEGEQFAVRPHHPAFELVFVYRQAEGALDLYVAGNKKAVEPLQAIFAEHILKCPELPADPADKRVYDLFPLRRREFGFTWPVSNGIESVAVSRLRLGLHKPKNAKLTVEADPKHNPKAVYDLLDKLSASLPSHEYYVTQVGITAQVKPTPTAAAKTVSFNITYPNSCSLKYDEIGLKLRAMLETSGIEPKELGDKGLAVDRRALLRCVDSPVAAAGDKESAEQRRERLRKRRDELKASGVHNFNQVLAEEEGRSVERIKQLLKDETADQPGNWFNLSPKGTTQKKSKPQR